MNRRQLMKCVSMAPIACAAGIVASVAHEEEPALPERTTSDDDDGATEDSPPDQVVFDEKIDWSLLRIHRDQANRHIKKIIIEFPEGPKTDRFRPKGPLRVESEDRQLLRRIDLTGAFYPLRIVFPEDGSDHIFSGAGAHVGTVSIETNRDRFEVWITTSGFAFPGVDLNHRQIFFSCILAYAIDDIVFLTTHAHLPTELLEGLSGELRLRREKIAFTTFGIRSLEQSP